MVPSDGGEVRAIGIAAPTAGLQSGMASKVVATAYGGPEVLAVVEEPVPGPGPGQVSVEVQAAGTNPVDYKQFSGSYGADESKLPLPVGMEAAGVVTAVGEGAHGPGGPLRTGDAVILYRITGAYASHVVVGAEAAVPKPEALSFEEASGLMLTGCTAVHALRATGVGPGDTVVVHGASGGVGLMAVQLAVADGARVIGTSSPSGHDELRRLGAQPLTYGDGLVERIRALAPDGVDAAVDTVGTDEAIDVSVALVADRDRIATIAGFQRGFALGLKVLGGAPGADPGTEVRAAARMELVTRVEEGTLSVVVAATYPLAAAAEALGQLATGHTHGKIVLVP
jgi:NADPH2:quinone reductase